MEELLLIIYLLAAAIGIAYLVCFFKIYSDVAAIKKSITGGDNRGEYLKFKAVKSDEKALEFLKLYIVERYLYIENNILEIEGKAKAKKTLEEWAQPRLEELGGSLSDFRFPTKTE